MTGPSSRVLLGHISSAHGIKGEVVVHTHTANPGDVAAYGPLTDAEGKATFQLKVLRISGRGVICRIAGIADRTAAEALRGIELYVERARLPDPEDEAFYHADLIGLAAATADGTMIGRVVAVQNFGAGDLLEIRVAGSTSTELIPFTRACVPAVDMAAGRLVIVRPAESADDDPAT